MFDSAYKIAVGMETAARNTKALQSKDRSAELDVVHRTDTKMPQSRRSFAEDKSSACYRCGQLDHTAERCRFKSARCRNCGKMGHLKAVCRSKTKQAKSSKPSHHSGKVKLLYEDSVEYPLHSIKSSLDRPPILITVELDGHPLEMELDTGASVSLISKATFQQLWPERELQSTNKKLTTYTGESLEILGIIDVHAKHGVNSATLPLMVIDLPGPSLLGRNWLESLRLDWSKLHFLHDSSLEKVLKKHSEVFRDELGTLQGFKAKIHIVPNVAPHFCRARPVPYALRSLVEEELERLVKQGVIEPVTYSDWAAPIVPVLKKDKKSLRICGDFSTTVNKASRLDCYPIPKVDDLFAKLAGGKQFSKLDLSQAYQQLLLYDEAKKYVVINTHKGLFQYNRLPFGVSSAPGIFQRTMESLLQDIPGVVVYLDDILITGANDQDHLANLELVLDRLEKSGLRLKRSKCLLMKRAVEYLGHTIDEQGLHPTADKLEAVKSAPRPKNVSELKSFLGLLTYYSRFLPNLASKLSPLYRLLNKSCSWTWGRTEQQTFQSAKQLLLSSKVLAHYDSSQELFLACDASPYGLGAVLSHRYPDGQEKPIGFASRTLTSAEKKYSQIEKEGLSCVFGIKKFHSYIYGRTFTLITDHKPLLSLLSEDKAVPVQASGRIKRWALMLGMYEYQMCHRKGSQHSNADALSRLPLPESLSSTPKRLFC